MPSQEQHAVDAVMQYAVNQLGFAADAVVLFAWSIGGYAASYAAACYPHVRHVVSCYKLLNCLNFMNFMETGRGKGLSSS